MLDMNPFKSEGRIFLFVALILFFLPILLVKVNFLKRTEVYTGLFKDASNGAPIDLVKVKMGNRITYSDLNGRYFLDFESLPLIGLFAGKNPFDPSSGRERNLNKMEVTPPFQFEPPAAKMTCSGPESRGLGRRFDCSALLYPQVFEMASRVMAAEAVSGVHKEFEIRARKSGLWDLLSIESQKLWTTREEFAGFLTLKEMTQVALNEQAVSFEVSRQPFFEGDLAKVEIKVADARGQRSKRFLNFKKLEGLWKLLFEETPKSVADYTSRNSWVLKKINP